MKSMTMMSSRLSPRRDYASILTTCVTETSTPTTLHETVISSPSSLFAVGPGLGPGPGLSPVRVSNVI